jgi:hypothetical protein
MAKQTRKKTISRFLTRLACCLCPVFYTVTEADSERGDRNDDKVAPTSLAIATSTSLILLKSTKLRVIHRTTSGRLLRLLMAAADDIRNQVASAIYSSLIHIAGGGFALTSCMRNITSAAEDQWTDELKKISNCCVSFTNKGVNREGIDGKPHDVEVRAALMLYHRILRGCCDKGKKRTIKQNEEKVKRKRKLSNDDDLHRTPFSDSNVEGEDGEKEVIFIEIISDLGTRRSIETINSLANLLAIEMEKELAGDAQKDKLYRMADKTTFDQRFTKTQSTSFIDIRPDDSGIICLLTLGRSKQLYSYGRIPCPNCIKWVKGHKGLWWHQLSVHGNQYSSAIEVAAGIANSSAIVPFQEWNDEEMIRSQQLKNEANQNVMSAISYHIDAKAVINIGAFDMVRMGKYDEFVKLIEVR